MTRPRRLARLSAWSAAWLLAAAGVLLAVAAWRCRDAVTMSCVRLPSITVYAATSPRRTNVSGWRTAESDTITYLTPAASVGPAVFYAYPLTAADWQADYATAGAGAIRHWRWLGFAFAHGLLPPQPVPTYVGIWLPTWFAVAVLLAPLAALAARRHRRRTRDRAGLCRACGYDLRATPGRCPECGNVAA